MVIYQIMATVAPELVPEFERFMRADHIPALLETGCFRSAAFTRSAPGRYRIRYEAPDAQALERYLAEFAEGLRSEFTARFPEGIELVRDVRTEEEGDGDGQRERGRR
jgi:hypothetical protein